MTLVNATRHASLSPVLVSVIAAAEPSLLSRLTVILSRLDILPLQIHSRLLAGDDVQDEDAAALEIDLYLRAEQAERRDRLVALLRTVIGVERVVVSV